MGAEPTVRLSFSKVLDSAITHICGMHPYLITLILITSCLGGYFGEIDKGVITIDCKNEIYNDVGYSATHYGDMNCKVIETDDQDFNRSEKRKQAATEERKDEDNDSKPELPKKS